MSDFISVSLGQETLALLGRGCLMAIQGMSPELEAIRENVHAGEPTAALVDSVVRREGPVDLLRFIGEGRGTKEAIAQARWAADLITTGRSPRVGMQALLAIVDDTRTGIESGDQRFEFPTPSEMMPDVDAHVVKLGREHPGFLDAAYRKRRDIIARISADFDPSGLRADDPYGGVPKAPYVEEEHEVWRFACRELRGLHHQFACREYLEARAAFPIEEDRIPQLRELNPRIQPLTGFRMVPVSGLVATQIFFGTLADRIFLSTQYIRHHSTPKYTPEPDVIHELIGHSAFLANPQMAGLNVLFGQAIRRVSRPEDIDRLGNVYWWTLEYGALMEDGQPKAYGAGLFSSFGELPRVEQVELLPFDLEMMEGTPKDVTRMQPFFFVAPSFDGMVAGLTEYLERRWLST